jgi:L,D-transpeptidase ErfK/SrfK
MTLKKLVKLATLTLAMIAPTSLFALTYPLTPSNDVVGQVHHVYTQEGERIYDVARQYQMGFYEMIESNPDMNRHSAIPTDFRITIPSEFVLPNVPREGIVINLPELRLYYFSKNGDQAIVRTEPLAIGRFDWLTPTLKSKIIEKNKNPKWFVPKSIQAAAARKGIYYPDVVKAGPKNPLGKFAMRLADRSYLIHGTNNPLTIGKRASSGCMRMYPEDIASLFQQVPIGTAVHIINEPFKLGWRNNSLYLEVHEPLQEFAEPEHIQIQQLTQMIDEMTRGKSVRVNWAAVHATLKSQNGVPMQISGPVRYRTHDYQGYYRDHDNASGDIQVVRVNSYNQ